MTGRCRIQVSPGLSSPAYGQLYSLLSQLMSIEFIVDVQGNQDTNTYIYTEIEPKPLKTTISTLRVCPANLADNETKREVEVTFSSHSMVPFPFRNRKITTSLVPTGTLALENNEVALVANRQGPLWAVSEIDGIKHYRSALSLPKLSNNQNFHDIFNGACFLETLVILEFLRNLPSFNPYQNPPLRAGFIIDDPNLHWSSYGYIDYRQLVAHAQKENYHVAFATIPLDNWYTNTDAAALFRAHSQHISLLVHGNDHGKEELAQPYGSDGRKEVLTTATARIGELEQAAKLQVSRVMVPPHGACSADMLALMPECGFEAACISANSVRAYNQDHPWAKTLGFAPAEVINDCPVLPRWGLTGNIKATLLVAAYLGQALILRGHHQDFKGGVEVFDDYAKFINSLGDVSWSNLATLARQSYQWRSQGKACYIKPFARKITFELPEKISEIIIESCKLTDNSACQYRLRLDGNSFTITTGERHILPKSDKAKRLLELDSLPPPLTTNGYRNKTSAKLILRRFLTETRDRCLL